MSKLEANEHSPEKDNYLKWLIREHPEIVIWLLVTLSGIGSLWQKDVVEFKSANQDYPEYDQTIDCDYLVDHRSDATGFMRQQMAAFCTVAEFMPGVEGDSLVTPETMVEYIEYDANDPDAAYNLMQQLNPLFVFDAEEPFDDPGEDLDIGLIYRVRIDPTNGTLRLAIGLAFNKDLGVMSGYLNVLGVRVELGEGGLGLLEDYDAHPGDLEVIEIRAIPTPETGPNTYRLTSVRVQVHGGQITYPWSRVSFFRMFPNHYVPIFYVAGGKHTIALNPNICNRIAAIDRFGISGGGQSCDVNEQSQAIQLPAEQCAQIVLQEDGTFSNPFASCLDLARMFPGENINNQYFCGGEMPGQICPGPAGPSFLTHR